MHSKTHSNLHLFKKWNPANVAITLLVALVFVLFMLLLLSLLSGPAQAQYSVPPTARQAATMPQFAGRLARAPASRVQQPSQPRASYRNSIDPRRRFINGGPLDDTTLYSNGPINGTSDAWTINFGFVVSDSFTMPANSTVTAMTFGAWLAPGDVLQSVEVSITSEEFGGTTYFDAVVNFTQTGCSGNQYGFNVCTESGAFNLSNLGQGTYWLNLSNAVVNSGDPVYWDENSGPSMASENTVGTIPSEAFTILGSTTTTCYYGCGPPPPPPCFQSGEQGVQVIHDFTDGVPSNLTLDSSGAIYGTTSSGGDNGLGMVFKLTERLGNWLFESLYSFVGQESGAGPGNVIIGPGGALFGIAGAGLHQCGYQGSQDCGLVYKLTPSPVICPAIMCGWNQTILYRFTGDPDGWAPTGSLVSDHAGNLYGITARGGAFGQGTVFELSPSRDAWTETVLYSFSGNNEGSPNSLLMGHDGNLYGIAGIDVFQLVQSANGWTHNVLYTFQNTQQDGGSPNSLVQDPSGNLYGISTWYYQYYDQDRTAGVFWEVSPSGRGWTFTELWLKQTDPRLFNDLFNSVAIDSQGNIELASTTIAYDWSCMDHNFGCWWYLYGQFGATFENEVFNPYGMTRDIAHKRLYGVTNGCGRYNRGTIWEISP